MTLNITVVADSGTQHNLSLELDSDGNTTTKSLTNAQILAALDAQTPLYELFNSTFATQAAARSAILHGSVTTQLKAGDVGRGCMFSIVPRNGRYPLGIDVNVDGDLKPILTFGFLNQGAPLAEVWVVRMIYMHSAIR